VAGIFVFGQLERSSYEIVAFDPDTYDGPVGTINVSYPAKTVLYVTDEKENKRLSVHSDSNELTAPCGRLALFKYECSVGADDGSRWSLTTYLYNKKCYALVKQDAVVELALGPPLEASVSHRIRKPNVTFDFLLKDSAGNNYSLTRINKRLPPPKFTVIDSSGDIAWSGSFKYG
jgi:hypothetical protein